MNNALALLLKKSVRMLFIDILSTLIGLTLMCRIAGTFRKLD